MENEMENKMDLGIVIIMGYIMRDCGQLPHVYHQQEGVIPECDLCLFAQMRPERTATLLQLISTYFCLRRRVRVGSGKASIDLGPPPPALHRPQKPLGGPWRPLRGPPCGIRGRDNRGIVIRISSTFFG